MASLKRNADALEWLSWLAYDSESIATGLIAMAWLQDGITDVESDTISYIYWLNDEDDENGLAVMEAVLDFPWIQDDITATEAEFIVSFEYFDHYNEKDAAAVLTMPFLKSLELDDVLAIRGIEELASNEDGDLLQALLGHPTLSSGITGCPDHAGRRCWHHPGSRRSPADAEPRLRRHRSPFQRD